MEMTPIRDGSSPKSAPASPSGAAPDLGTGSEIKIVEGVLLTIQEYPTVSRLLGVLPGPIPRPRLVRIVKHLEDSNKILVDKDGAIVWIAVHSPKSQALHDELESNVLL